MPPATARPPAGTSALRPARLRWRQSALTSRLVTLALAGLIIAVLTGRPEFAGAAAPAAALLLAWRTSRPAAIGVGVRLTAGHLVEGDEASLIVTLSGCGDYLVELRMIASPAVIAGDPAGSGQAVRLPFRVEQWGHRQLGTLQIVLRDKWRLADGRAAVELPQVDCTPRPAVQRSKILLSRLPSQLGEHPARVPGDGTEFAGIREFVPGDRQRRINWPATTRRGTLQLNTFAAERAQNVVVIADASANLGPPGASSVDRAYRGAAGAMRAYLAARDRVGLIVFGRRLSWMGLGTGERHFRRLVDLMIAGSGGWEPPEGLARLPKAALPPGALIMVFSPLLDTRLVEALRDLRERGFAVLVVDVLDPALDSPRDAIAQLTRRIWQMEQEAVRFSLREIGIPVVHWDGLQNMDELLAPYARRTGVTHR